MEITVQKKKKSVLVLDWGRAPFGVEENLRGKVYIPDGFKVQTVAARKVWIATTRVRDGTSQYCFYLKDDPKKTSDWKKSPSGAFRQANERIKNVFFKKGTNAALILGVTYPSLQAEILSRFGPQLLEAASYAPSTSRRSVPDDDDDETLDDQEEDEEPEEPKVKARDARQGHVFSAVGTTPTLAMAVPKAKTFPMPQNATSQASSAKKLKMTEYASLSSFSPSTTTFFASPFDCYHQQFLGNQEPLAAPCSLSSLSPMDCGQQEQSLEQRREAGAEPFDVMTEGNTLPDPMKDIDSWFQNEPSSFKASADVDDFLSFQDLFEMGDLSLTNE